MSLVKKINARKRRRVLRVRSNLVGDALRVSVFRSLKNIYAQVIDDAAHKTLVSCSSLELSEVSGDKKAVAYAVGKELAKRASSQDIKAVKFDRGAARYHGRVKALADGLREGGLEF